MKNMLLSIRLNMSLFVLHIKLIVNPLNNEVLRVVACQQIRWL